MDLPGFEPGAFRMQSERDTTTLQTLGTCLSPQLTLNAHTIRREGVYLGVRRS